MLNVKCIYHHPEGTWTLINGLLAVIENERLDELKPTIEVWQCLTLVGWYGVPNMMFYSIFEGIWVCHTFYLLWQIVPHLGSKP